MFDWRQAQLLFKDTLSIAKMINVALLLNAGLGLGPPQKVDRRSEISERLTKDKWKFKLWEWIPSNLFFTVIESPSSGIDSKT